MAMQRRVTSAVRGRTRRVGGHESSARAESSDRLLPCAADGAVGDGPRFEPGPRSRCGRWWRLRCCRWRSGRRSMRAWRASVRRCPRADLRASSHLRAGASSHRKGLSSLPPAAQGPVSEALGADNPAYRVRASSGGISRGEPRAASQHELQPLGDLRELGLGTWLDLSLRAVGFGTSLRALGEVAPRVEGQPCLLCARGSQRVVRQRAARPRAGLHDLQGAISPSGRRPDALDGADGQRHGLARLRTGRASTSRRSGRSVLRYNGLIATDARGRALHSWLELHAGRILLRVDAAGARYPLRIDPFVQQGEKLTGGGERGEEGAFGYSVALSAERRIRADRRPERQRQGRRGVGLPALGHDLGPAGPEAHRQRRGRRGRIRRERGALRKRRIRADRRPR